MREILKNNSKLVITPKIEEMVWNIDNLIWKNIMEWWSNALWVYEIKNENLVIIIKSIWSYKFLWDLAFLWKNSKYS